MTETVLVHGLHVPKWEAQRFQALRVVDNMPDLDVSKVKAGIAFCARTDAALDIGAHIGATALAMSKVFRRVLAFEAIPDVFDVLEKNAAGTLIECRNIAVGKESGSLAFEFLARHTQLSHVLRNGEKPHFDGSIVVGPVPALPIDALDIEGVSFMKIDVEGTELDVLQGARATICRCRPVILIEQGGNEVKFHGGIRNEGATYLEALGMTRLKFPFNDDRLYGFQ